MAENYAKANQYQYAATSSLVLQANRKGLPRRDQEPTGEPDSLWGKIDPKDFGTRAEREMPKGIEEKKKKAAARQSEEALERKRKKKEENAMNRAYGHTSVLSATEDWEGLNYRPRAGTREAYELILSFVYEYLGDQERSIIRSAADVILETLKTDTLKDFDKKKEIEKILSANIESEKFAQLVNLGKKITDYFAEGDAMDVDDNGDKVGEIDANLGVAVIFDDEDDDEDDQFELKEEDEDDLDEEEQAAAAAAAAARQAAEQEEATESSDEEDGFKTVLPGQEKKKKGKKSAFSTEPSDDIYPHDIDAFWLQRQIAAHYPDPHTAQEKTDRKSVV